MEPKESKKYVCYQNLTLKRLLTKEEISDYLKPTIEKLYNNAKERINNDIEIEVCHYWTKSLFFIKLIDKDCPSESLYGFIITNDEEKINLCGICDRFYTNERVNCIIVGDYSQSAQVYLYSLYAFPTGKTICERKLGFEFEDEEGKELPGKLFIVKDFIEKRLHFERAYPRSCNRLLWDTDKGCIIKDFYGIKIVNTNEEIIAHYSYRLDTEIEYSTYYMYGKKTKFEKLDINPYEILNSTECCSSFKNLVKNNFLNLFRYKSQKGTSRILSYKWYSDHFESFNKFCDGDYFEEDDRVPDGLTVKRERSCEKVLQNKNGEIIQRGFRDVRFYFNQGYVAIVRKGICWKYENGRVTNNYWNGVSKEDEFYRYYMCENFDNPKQLGTWLINEIVPLNIATLDEK